MLQQTCGIQKQDGLSAQPVLGPFLFDVAHGGFAIEPIAQKKYDNAVRQASLFDVAGQARTPHSWDAATKLAWKDEE
jgi:hypothetical protein